jgi:hypothetical protein
MATCMAKAAITTKRALTGTSKNQSKYLTGFFLENLLIWRLEFCFTNYTFLPLLACQLLHREARGVSGSFASII